MCENHMSGCPFVRGATELHVEISEDECCRGLVEGIGEQNRETRERPAEELLPLLLILIAFLHK